MQRILGETRFFWDAARRLRIESERDGALDDLEVLILHTESPTLRARAQARLDQERRQCAF